MEKKKEKEKRKWLLYIHKELFVWQTMDRFIGQ